MKNSEPKNGDFAAYLEQLSERPTTSNTLKLNEREDTCQPEPQIVNDTEQTLPAESFDLRTELTPEEIIQRDNWMLKDSGHSVEFLDELSELEVMPVLTDEELMRQALQHPGEDGDASTPE
jgi:hypothetical protein